MATLTEAEHRRAQEWRNLACLLRQTSTRLYEQATWGLWQAAAIERELKALEA